MKTLFDTGIMTDVQVAALLKSHYDQIIESIQYGWNAYHQIVRNAYEESIAFNSTTRAGIIHNNIVRRANYLFGSAEDIFCYPENEIFTIDFYGKVRLRFKKLNNSLKPGNIYTRQQKKFASQTLFGSVTNITAGYRLDKTGISLRDMHLVCWYNDRLSWNIQLSYIEAIETDANLDNEVQSPTKIIISETGKAKTA